MFRVGQGVRVVADAAQITGQEVRVDRGPRILGVARDDLVAQLAKQRTGLLDGYQLCLPNPDGQRWDLGTQGNSQLARLARRRRHEFAFGTRHR